MAFSESSRGESGNPSRPEKEPESPAEHEKEGDERRRQEALTYLVETGRAMTPEEAESYIAQLNGIKEKLIIFIRDLLRDGSANTELRGGVIDTGVPQIYFKGKLATVSDIPKITLDAMDRADPELWRLEKTVRPHYAGRRKHGAVENLNVKFSEAGTELRFVPEDDSYRAGMIVEALKSRLTDEQLEFLRKEYVFALRDLARELHTVADTVAMQQDFVNLALRRSLSSK